MESGSVTTSPEARLTAALGERVAAGHRLLVPYLTAGFPDAAATPALLRGLAEAGADAIELGVPFSDPLADGPTIQAASQKALEAGAGFAAALEALRAFRAEHATPVILFTYLNPILAYGAEAAVRDAVAAGADGLLLTDLPLGGDPALEAMLEASPLALVRLIAPTTSEARRNAIAARSQGFVYYISRTGVTGARATLPETLAGEVASLRAASTVPVLVGFGISSPAQARAVGEVADGIVVGSAFIQRLGDEGAASALAFVRALREALP